MSIVRVVKLGRRGLICKPCPAIGLPSLISAKGTSSLEVGSDSISDALPNVGVVGRLGFGLGALATIAAQAPDNLSIVVLNNRRYGETGMQATHTALGADLVMMARGAGFPEALAVTDDAAVADLAGRLRRCEGLLLADIMVMADEPPRVLPERDAVVLKHSFRKALDLK